MPTRRDLLRFEAAAAALGPASLACRRGGLDIASLDIASSLFEKRKPSGDGRPVPPRVARLLGRAGYGPRPGDLDRAATMGADAWIEEQLSPSSIPDVATHWRVRRIETVALDTPDLFDLPRASVLRDLRRATILRAAGSERQLLEAITEFWTDHFNVYAGKFDCAYLKVVDDRDVIRKHALGSFRDLLRASAESPAMLEYLDGRANVAGAPNENHARELLELHTLGVAGGYTQRDVQELARALTGWRLRSFWHRGRAFVEAARHDASPKTILGRLFAAGAGPGADAKRDLEAILDRLAAHPSTAAFVARKICRRFVADEPPAPLVERAARTFTATKGSIRDVLGMVLRSEELAASPPKLKRPLAYAISAIRALPAKTDGGSALQSHLAAMGQLPFDWPTPDGFPDGEEHWRAGLLPRWNFALSLAAGEIRGTRMEAPAASASAVALASAVLGRALAEGERRTFARARSPEEGAALALAHPDFQYT
jgi:uncharacterized protein (DUF1800 family)